MDFSKLNQHQHDAVLHCGNPALVIAGAGTGKTTTIVYRIARLILEEEITPSNILFLTFTKKAAAEVKSRIADKLDGIKCDIGGGTFHSWAIGVLRKYGGLINLSNRFSIYEPDDCQSLLRFIINEREIENFKENMGFFPKKDELYSGISNMKNNRLKLEDVFYKYKTRLDEIEEVVNLFEKRKQAEDILDYDDILIYTYNLFLQYDDILKRACEHYKHILVDEYQDTNYLQNDLLKLFYKYNKNIFAVGDDAQSIYLFRGARVDNILNFEKDFGATVYKIDINYRSTKSILDFTNNFSKKFRFNFEKQLMPFDEKKGKIVKHILFDSQNHESEHICKSILKSINSNKSFSDFAILVKFSMVSLNLQVQFTRYKIPFKVFGGVNFFTRKHIKDIICFFRVIENFKDEVSFFRILNLLKGFGEKTIKSLMIYIRENFNNLSFVDLKKYSLSGPKKQPLYKFFETLKTAESLNTKSDFDKLFDLIKEYYMSLIQDNNKINEKLVSNEIDALKILLLSSDNLTDFLQNLIFDRNNIKTEDDNSEKEFVTLSTIHSAKGLEWDNVIVMGVKDGIFPDKKHKGIKELEEEDKRLFYVACTRARKILLLVSSMYDNYSYVPKISYLEGISGDILDKKYKYENNKNKRLF